MPEIRWSPGTAEQMMKDFRPHFAAEGVEFDADGEPIFESLEHAQEMLRLAQDRYNLALVTPQGTDRELCITALRLAAVAFAERDLELAVGILQTVKPISDGSDPTVSGCIGVGLGHLDTWLQKGKGLAPGGTAALAKVPQDIKWAVPPARDMLALAVKGRAFEASGSLIARHGGEPVLYGVAVAVGAVLTAWQALEDVPLEELAYEVLSATGDGHDADNG